MPREKQFYRETLSRLDDKFPEKEVLSQSELAEFLGVSTKTIQRKWKSHYNKMLCGYSKTKVASVLAD